MRKNKSPKMHLAISGTRLVPEALIERRPLLRAEKKRGKRVKARLIESVVPSEEGGQHQARFFFSLLWSLR